MRQNLSGQVSVQYTLRRAERQGNAGFQLASLLVDALKRIGGVKSHGGAVQSGQSATLGTLLGGGFDCFLTRLRGGGIECLACQTFLGK